MQKPEPGTPPSHPRAGTHDELVRRAEALIPVVRQRAPRTDEMRRLPDETRRDLREVGLARVLQPARYGGQVKDRVTLMTGRALHGQALQHTRISEAALAVEAAKAVFVRAFRDSGLSRVALGQRLGVDEKVVRRMLDPHHHTTANRLQKALHALGRDLIVESRAA